MIDHTGHAKWLINQFSLFNPIPVYAAIFGSFAHGSPAPIDCDILIVLKSPISNPQWLSVHDTLSHLIERFEDCWNIKLSPTVMTMEEVYEKGGFISSILERPLIDIFGSKNDLPVNGTIID